VSLPDNFDAETAKKLVCRGVDVNNTTESDLTALQAACAKGTADAVKWLLSKGAHINAKGGRYGTALCAAVDSETHAEQKVLLLLEHEIKADINLSGEDKPTALQRAASKGNEPLVDLLLRKGAEVNLAKPRCDTPLNNAIAHRGIGLATIADMLNRGADIIKRGVAGKLPVHIAAISNRPDVMEVLCSAGADACAKDGDGLSPLMYGLLKGSVPIVGSLLSKDAYDLYEADPKGQTPLIVATIVRNGSNLNSLLDCCFKEPRVLNARDF
jgi:ankyrin repeat protein